MIIFCIALSLTIGCKTSTASTLENFPYFGVAELLSFIVSLAFCSLFSMATHLQVHCNLCPVMPPQLCTAHRNIHFVKRGT